MALLALLTSGFIFSGPSYYPQNCNKAYFTGDSCVMICSGKDSCQDSFETPKAKGVQSFIVRCVNGDPACNSLKAFKKPSNSNRNIDIYLMCIGICNSAEEAAESAEYVYCGKCDGIRRKKVNKLTTVNGVAVVLFTNGVAVSRVMNPPAVQSGIINQYDGNELKFFLFIMIFRDNIFVNQPLVV